MIPHIKYPKIHSLHKSEVSGILEGNCLVQEKVDGANLSVWIDEDNIVIGSRTQIRNDSFNGAKEYCQNHNGIYRLLCILMKQYENQDVRLFGEWLVRHTIAYKECNYKHFYMFDIMVNGEFLCQEDVEHLANCYNIRYPKVFGRFENPTVDQLKEIAGQSEIGDIGEGIVIKNENFINRFGDKPYAKLVTEKFQEDNGINFGGNNKHNPLYREIYIMNKYMTLARVEKIVHKMESMLDEPLDMKHIPMCMNMAYHDLITEEIWEIQKKTKIINLGELQRLCYKKAKSIYTQILTGDISVANQ